MMLEDEHPRLEGVQYATGKSRGQLIDSETMKLLLLLLLLLLSRFSRVRFCVTPQTADHQAPCPWNSPGKNSGVRCHFLLQCMKVNSENEVAQQCLTPRDPMDWSLPGSSVRGIFQATVLEWGAIAFSNEVARPNQKLAQVYVSGGSSKV